MKAQPDKYSCGVYAVMNAAICVGVRLQKRQILKFSNTTKKGTSEIGVKAALTGNNFLFKEIDYRNNSLTTNKEKAFQQLSKAILEEKPTILCVDKWDHWIVVVGTMGSKYVVFDSDSTKKNLKENGVYVLTVEELSKRWLFNGGYYGIIVSKGETQ